MESLSKQELISTITKQADQIKRYEARLRDVVAAYKGLAKEKEALEVSLKALNKAEGENEGTSDESVATLVLSLSTLTAEKCRMEEAFQADKKVTREKYENMLAAMREETKTLVQQHQVEVSNLKAKIAYEIQEREKERADHAAMLKELHMKFDVERKTKEKLEDKVVYSSENQATQAELEKRVRDLSSSLEAARRRLARAEARTAETPALLVRLQNKLALVEQAHAVAIREEQIKVKRAEEGARKASARHEERVAALESRVAELSRAVGRDDARRRADTLLIQRLRDSLNERMVERMESCVKEDTPKSETDNDKLADSEYLHTLIDKLHILKKELIAENDKLGSPVDVAAAFSVDGYDVHMKCREQYDSLRAEFDDYKNTKAKASASECAGEAAARREAAALRERLDALRRLLDDEKRDKEDWIRLHEEKLKSERAYHEEVTSELRNRITSLEQQLGAARERYAALLHDTDGYLRRERARKVSEEPLWRDGATESAPPHLLHYAHELARRDLDIQTLRKDKHALEGQYRDCQREATIEKERFKEVIRTLKEEIDRLRRVQSRSGANLEYLKNVVVSFLSAGGCGGDAAARRHMLNAIAAVLHLTPAETAQVMAAI